jgi:hypothetical protein
MLPNFLIVGAMKSGTTSLASYLSAHPDVFMSPVKELAFFERESVWSRGTGWYEEQFAGAGGETAIGEATPNYMFFPWSVERIAATLPGVRVIACLREPVARAHSHYLHWYEDMVRERRPFARAVEDELAAGADAQVEDVLDADPPYYGYLARGRYLEQLTRLADTFGRENVHVVLLDDLEADPAAVYAATCRFLGVDDAFRPDNLGVKENAYHQWRPAWLWRFMIRHRVFDRMPQRVAQWLALDVMTPRLKEVPAMAPEVRERLAAFYAPHNERLGEWLGRDLSRWSA